VNKFHAPIIFFKKINRSGLSTENVISNRLEKSAGFHSYDGWIFHHFGFITI